MQKTKTKNMKEKCKNIERRRKATKQKQRNSVKLAWREIGTKELVREERDKNADDRWLKEIEREKREQEERKAQGVAIREQRWSIGNR